MQSSKYGPWCILRPLAKGGQGRTFLAFHQDDVSKQPHALKLLHGTGGRERFRREIETYKSLSHPNILRLIDADPDATRPWAVTEYCSGGSLNEEMLGDIPLADRLDMFLQICSAIQHAHENGIIHRDIKPANILLKEDGRTPVVADFGLAFLSDDDDRLTRPNEQVGPRFFMAPELEDGRAKTVQPTSDIYSLGKLLYWLVAGKVFAREKQNEPAWDLRPQPPQRTHLFVYEVLDIAIIEETEARVQTLDEFINVLNSVIRKVEMDAYPTNLSVPLPCKWCGIGEYQAWGIPATADDPRSSHHVVRQIGLHHSDQNNTPLVLKCPHCGHIELFFPDMTTNRKVWKRQ